ncbi:hypothetical protein F2P81_002757 [Scophthalmus maximus]|uniref:Uncharacterized protein n=1 Tax=Scophthalmus maximus TaxID=52904 RepID=A0A6A4TPA7_SCOMX|nr:hypothetical protein F2P81_002757 [Scophthalmus maximus]
MRRYQTPTPVMPQGLCIREGVKLEERRIPLMHDDILHVQGDEKSRERRCETSRRVSSIEAECSLTVMTRRFPVLHRHPEDSMGTRPLIGRSVARPWMMLHQWVLLRLLHAHALAYARTALSRSDGEMLAEPRTVASFLSSVTSASSAADAMPSPADAPDSV